MTMFAKNNTSSTIDIYVHEGRRLEIPGINMPCCMTTRGETNPATANTAHNSIA